MKICKEKYKWVTFAHINSVFFQHITNHETTRKDLMKPIHYMIYIQEQCEQGQLSHEQAKVIIQEHMYKLFSHKLKPNELTNTETSISNSSKKRLSRQKYAKRPAF